MGFEGLAGPVCCCGTGGGGGGVTICPPCSVDQSTPASYSLVQNTAGVPGAMTLTGTLTYGPYTTSTGGTATDWHSPWQAYPPSVFNPDCIFYRIIGLCSPGLQVGRDASGAACAAGTGVATIIATGAGCTQSLTCTPFTLTFNNACRGLAPFTSGVIHQ